jgi:hypothetical protein
MLEAMTVALMLAFSDRACIDLAHRPEFAGFTVGKTYEPGRLVAFTCRANQPAGWFVTSEPGPGRVVALFDVDAKGGR